MSVRQSTVLGMPGRMSRRWQRPLYETATWITVLALATAITTAGGVLRALPADAALIPSTPVEAAVPAPSAPSLSTGAELGVSSLPASVSKVPLLVKFKGAATDAEIDAAVGALGGEVVRDLPQLRTRVLNIPSEALDAVVAAYGRHPAVEHAAAAVRLEQAGAPNDAGYAQQWALPKISWDMAYGVVPVLGSAKIAVLDTGVDTTHPDLLGRTSLGRSFVGGVAEVDPSGHGTALAGIAAANVNNLIGMAGVAYAGTTVTSVQVLQPDGTGWDSDVVAGVLWAADNNAKVILMGFSSPNFSAALQDALNYAWTKGAVLVAATGNAGSTAPSYPAGMANVIGVAATDQNDAIAAISNTGSAAVAAPGVGIYATQPGGGYANIGGTSPRAAEAAGLAPPPFAGGKTEHAAAGAGPGAAAS